MVVCARMAMAATVGLQHGLAGSALSKRSKGVRSLRNRRLSPCEARMNTWNAGSNWASGTAWAGSGATTIRTAQATDINSKGRACRHLLGRLNMPQVSGRVRVAQQDATKHRPMARNARWPVRSGIGASHVCWRILICRFVDPSHPMRFARTMGARKPARDSPPPLETPHATEAASGLDASFLYLETPETPMHVGAMLPCWNCPRATVAGM